MGGVRGDFAALQKLMRGMQRLSGVDKKLAELAAADIGAEAARTFDAQQNPYGESWDVPFRLVRSGALRAGATTPQPAGARLRFRLPRYARYQHPPRFWASRGNPPPAWLEAAQKHMPAAVQAVIEGG